MPRECPHEKKNLITIPLGQVRRGRWECVTNTDYFSIRNPERSRGMRDKYCLQFPWTGPERSLGMRDKY
jgi:hypothetical protein